jgi:phosphopantothenate synthetase
MADLDEADLESLLASYDNRAVLRRSVEEMISHLSHQFSALDG